MWSLGMRERQMRAKLPTHSHEEQAKQLNLLSIYLKGGLPYLLCMPLPSQESKVWGRLGKARDDAMESQKSQSTVNGKRCKAFTPAQC